MLNIDFIRSSGINILLYPFLFNIFIILPFYLKVFSYKFSNSYKVIRYPVDTRSFLYNIFIIYPLRSAFNTVHSFKKNNIYNFIISILIILSVIIFLNFSIILLKLIFVVIMRYKNKLPLNKTSIWKEFSPYSNKKIVIVNYSIIRNTIKEYYDSFVKLRSYLRYRTCLNITIKNGHILKHASCWDENTKYGFTMTSEEIDEKGFSTDKEGFSYKFNTLNGYGYIQKFGSKNIKQIEIKNESLKNELGIYGPYYLWQTLFMLRNKMPAYMVYNINRSQKVIPMTDKEWRHYIKTYDNFYSNYQSDINRDYTLTLMYFKEKNRVISRAQLLLIDIQNIKNSDISDEDKIVKFRSLINEKRNIYETLNRFNDMERGSDSNMIKLLNDIYNS